MLAGGRGARGTQVRVDSLRGAFKLTEEDARELFRRGNAYRVRSALTFSLK